MKISNLFVLLPIISSAIGFSNFQKIWPLGKTLVVQQKKPNLIDRTFSLFGKIKGKSNLPNPKASLLSNFKFPEISFTHAIILANIVTYIATKGLPGFEGNRYLFQKLMKIDRAVARGETYRLLSACFCHGSLMHLGFNMYSLSSVGPQVYFYHLIILSLFHVINYKHCLD